MAKKVLPPPPPPAQYFPSSGTWNLSRLELRIFATVTVTCMVVFNKNPAFFRSVSASHCLLNSSTVHHGQKVQDLCYASITSAVDVLCHLANGNGLL